MKLQLKIVFSTPLLQFLKQKKLGTKKIKIEEKYLHLLDDKFANGGTFCLLKKILLIYF
jgi:hypothetical protein